jgi:hypothetical protein
LDKGMWSLALVWSHSHFKPSIFYIIICNKQTKPELNRCRKSTISRNRGKR